MFNKGWNNKHESIRNIVRKLVDEKRLQFVIGGWQV